MVDCGSSLSLSERRGNLKTKYQQCTSARIGGRVEDAYGSFSHSKVPTVGPVTFWRLFGRYSVVSAGDPSSSPAKVLDSIRFQFDGLVFNDLNLFLTRSILLKNRGESQVQKFASNSGDSLNGEGKTAVLRSRRPLREKRDT